MHQSNAGLGPSVCGIAARHDQGEVAALPLGEGKLNPKHGKRLEEAALADWISALACSIRAPCRGLPPKWDGSCGRGRLPVWTTSNWLPFVPVIGAMIAA